MNTFIISDPHFSHFNIIRYCNRPYNTVDDMNDCLIKNWNNTVNNDDIIICNGDFIFDKKDTGIFSRLKGKKILVKGNHDHKATLAFGWEAVHDIYEFSFNNKRFVCCHYPLFSWNKKFHGSIHLYGHVHNIPEDQLKMPNAYNVCVEYTDYKPVNLLDFKGDFDYHKASFDYNTQTWG